MRLFAIALLMMAPVAAAKGTLIVKPYYDTTSKDRYYDLTLEISHSTLWDHLSYVSAVGGEWSPVPERASLNYVRTEHGLETDWNSFSIGAGIASQLHPATAKEMRYVYGHISCVLWD